LDIASKVKKVVYWMSQILFAAEIAFDNRRRLGLKQAFHDQLARSIHHGHRDGGLMHVHPDILFLTHKGAPFR
jgi:hypothetical protein